MNVTFFMIKYTKQEKSRLKRLFYTVFTRSYVITTHSAEKINIVLLYFVISEGIGNYEIVEV